MQASARLAGSWSGKHVARELHRDRAEALVDAASAHVRERGRHHARQVDGAVLAEPLVLDGDERFGTWRGRDSKRRALPRPARGRRTPCRGGRGARARRPAGTSSAGDTSGQPVKRQRFQARPSRPGPAIASAIRTVREARAGCVVRGRRIDPDDLEPTDGRAALLRVRPWRFLLHARGAGARSLPGLRLGFVLRGRRRRDLLLFVVSLAP